MRNQEGGDSIEEWTSKPIKIKEGTDPEYGKYIDKPEVMLYSKLEQINQDNFDSKLAAQQLALQNFIRRDIQNADTIDPSRIKLPPQKKAAPPDLPSDFISQELKKDDSRVIPQDDKMKMHGKFQMKKCGDFYLHHKSLLNDPTLKPRTLGLGESLFEIILPWVPDQYKEMENKVKEQFELGLISELKYQKLMATFKKFNSNSI